MPATMSLASIGLFGSKAPSFSNLSPRSGGAAPSQVDGASLRDGSRGGQPGSCSPSFGLLCNIMPRSHFGVSLVLLWHCLGHSFVLSQRLAPAAVFAVVLPSLHSGASTSCLASLFAQGTNASDLAAAALSASLACSTPAVPSARPGATLPLVHARQPRGFDFTHDHDRDCECKPKGVRVSGVTIQDM
jgi:hypothetical protein